LKDLHTKREEEAKEKEKQDELERRRIGQQMRLDKQKKEEDLLRKQAEEIRRDRLEQQKLQEKLKAQIQQDREDKRRKYEDEQTGSVQSVKPKVTTVNQENSPITYTRSRLQFRLTDGSFFTEDFPCDGRISDVYAYLHETLPTAQYSPGSYVLRTTHTRSTITRDNPKTLKDLDLVPSAVLLVIPRGSPSPSIASSASATTNLSLSNILQSASLIFAWFMLQLNFLYQLISSKLFGARPSSATDRQTPNRTHQQASNKKSKENFKRDSTESNTIHRFRNMQDDDDDDDDDKRTWNGNSTEQL
jgi:UBX domain-containing protein 1/4